MTTEKYTTDNVFDGIALVALANFGTGDYYDKILEGIAKMREVEVRVVSDKIFAHLKHLQSLIAPLVGQMRILKLVDGKLDDDLKAKVEELQKPDRAEYMRYCAKQLGLIESRAIGLMDRMIAKALN